MSVLETHLKKTNENVSTTNLIILIIINITINFIILLHISITYMTRAYLVDQIKIRRANKEVQSTVGLES